jgi:hypothetical protein
MLRRFKRSSPTSECAPRPLRAREGRLGQILRDTGVEVAIAGKLENSVQLVCGVLSLRHFRLASWRSLSLGGGGRDSGAAHLDLLGPPGWCSGWWPHDGDVAAGGDFVLAIVRFGADDGARAIGATDAAAAVEVRGRRRRPPGSNAALRGSAACSLSDISGWRAGVLYPLAVVAAIPARRISTCSGRLVGAAAGGRTMVMSPPAATSF